MRAYKLAPFCGVLLLALVSCGCNKLKARDQLNKGVAAYRNAQFQTAIDHFKQAVALDPSLLNAKLYLATAIRQLYVPNGDSPENAKIGNQAIQAFEDVLKDDPNNVYLLSVDLKKHPDVDVHNPQTIDPSWVSKFHIPVR